MMNNPRVNGCPILEKETSVCMCMCMKCGDVDRKSCFGIRSAFQYGYNMAEDKALQAFKEISQAMLKRVEALQSE